MRIAEIRSRFRALLAALLLAAGIGCAGDADNADTAAAGADTAAMAPDTAGMATSPTTPTADARLDPNTASRDELIAIQGMTPAAADAIIAGRPHQDMRSVDRALSSLPAAVRDSVYTRVWKRLDLNAASVAEIELIPGVGPRMRHEFEEYRPYTSMAQFRREIGKYVDSTEVARLESYVEIR